MLEKTEGKCLGCWELWDGENAFGDRSKGGASSAHDEITMGKA
jgi:hypothetical protein